MDLNEELVNICITNIIQFKIEHQKHYDNFSKTKPFEMKDYTGKKETNITGSKYGHLKVLGFVTKDIWQVQCSICNSYELISLGQLSMHMRNKCSLCEFREKAHFDLCKKVAEIELLRKFVDNAKESLPLNLFQGIMQTSKIELGFYNKEF